MSKERIPYFNFYPTDFMRGVRGLTAQEVGIYTMLLCRMYEENGPIDLHEERLAAYCGCRTSTLARTLSRLCDLGKINLVGKQIFNDRAAIEIDKRNRVVKSNSTAGVLSAEKRKQNQQAAATPVQQPFNHTDTDTDTEKREAKASPKKRGTRLPDDWFLPMAWGQWAVAEGYAQDVIRREAENFKDYWKARSGPTASKLDWEATWRIWMRKAPKGNQNGKHDNAAFGAAIHQLADRLAEGTARIDTSNRDPFAVIRGGNAEADPDRVKRLL